MILKINPYNSFIVIYDMDGSTEKMHYLLLDSLLHVRACALV
jgi:hypothetical protein